MVESDPSQLTQLIINGISSSLTTLTSIAALDKVKENLSKKKNKLRKLSSYTDKAFSELSNILDDVAVHYKAIDNSIGKLEGLSHDDNDMAMKGSRRVLSDILAGKLRRNLKDARLRCGDIYKVWEDKPSLHDWLAILYKKSYLKDSEFQEIESTFSSLSSSDGAYVRSIASIILKLLDSNDIHNAKIEVKKIKDDLAEPRQQLSHELANLKKRVMEL